MRILWKCYDFVFEKFSLVTEIRRTTGGLLCIRPVPELSFRTYAAAKRAASALTGTTGTKFGVGHGIR